MIDPLISPFSGLPPFAVQFTDTSVGKSLNKWNWNFGDGSWFNTTSSAQRNPVYVYQTPGTYTAKLTVCNASGCNTTVPGLRINASILIPPIVKFTTNVSTGLTPNPVKFTDQSTISPTSWNWNFGDGTWFNTTNSSLRSPVHIYPSAGTYTAKLIACNTAGCNTTGPTRMVSASMAGFTTNVTSGGAPLGVKFFDTTTGVTLSRWNWSFGDNTWFNTTTLSKRNATHTYTSPGSYTARLMVCTGSGSSLRCNTTPVGQVITVTGAGPIEYKIYAEVGESSLHDSAQGFWNTINGASAGGYSWADSGHGVIYGIGNAKASHWSSDASQWIGQADFLFFSGHGTPGGIIFTDDSNNMVYADTMGLNSTGKVKWAVLDSCSSLNSTTSWMFMPSFNNGLHMLLGWDTDVAPSEDQSNAEYRGEVFARLLQGIYQGAWNQRFNMSEAWKLAGFFTYNSYPGHSFYDVYDAVMYASNCADDSLPGWGPFCTNPQGPIYWDHQLVFANTTQDQMNSQIVNLEVDGNSITVSIPVASDKAMMYIPVKSVYTKEWASSLAKSLGMSGDIRETEDSFYANDMDTKNNVFIVRKDASLILFQKFGSRSGIVQSDAASVSAVNKFLLSNNLMPPGYPEPRLMKNDGGSITQAGERKTNWITNVISYQQVLDGLPVIGAQFNVEVDSGGNIVGLIRNWREYEPFKEISQKKPDDVLKEFRAISLRNAKDSSEKVIVTGVLLGYRMQRSGDTGEYLQPVYIFKGHYKNGDSIKPLEPVIIDTKEGDVKENTTSPIPTTIRKTETTYNITQNTTLIANTSIVTTQNVTIPKISSTIDPIVDWNNEIENTTSDTFNNLNFTGNLIDNSSVRSNKTMNNGSISGNISENVHNGR